MIQSANPHVSPKRLAMALAAVFLGPPVLFLLVAVLALIPAVLWNHASNLLDGLRGGAAVVESAIFWPEAPLPGDDAFSTVLRIAEQVSVDDLNEAQFGRNCRDDTRGPRPDWPWCAAFLTRLAGPLKAWDEWLAGPSPYKLERPHNLGRHSRFLITAQQPTRKRELPDFRAFLDLGDVLAMRALHRLHTGQATAAEKDLRTLFALGAFLQQNPLGLSSGVGLEVTRKAVQVMADNVEPTGQKIAWEAALPDLRQNLDRLRWQYELDALSFKESLGTAPQALWNHLIGGPYRPDWVTMDPTLARVLGLYSTSRTWREYQALLHAVVMQIESGRLGRVFYEGPHDCSSFRGGMPQFDLIDEIVAPVRDVFRWWAPNIVGRVFLCDLEEMGHLTGYLTNVGLAMDQVEATRVVMAARRFKIVHGRWPVREADLVPGYLRSWPVSALDGKPLQRLEGSNGMRGIRVMGPNILPPCLTGDRCYFLFSLPPKKPGG